LSPKVRAELTRVLQKALAELPEEAQVLAGPEHPADVSLVASRRK